MELDYDKLLDDWETKLNKWIDEANKKSDDSEANSYKQGYYEGLQDGICRAIGHLVWLEVRKKKNYEKH